MKRGHEVERRLDARATRSIPGLRHHVRSAIASAFAAGAQSMQTVRVRSVQHFPDGTVEQPQKRQTPAGKVMPSPRDA
jgi:hypothetical protein